MGKGKNELLFFKLGKQKYQSWFSASPQIFHEICPEKASAFILGYYSEVVAQTIKPGYAVPLYFIEIL